jgi:putative heme-binding domain-containing protein
VKNSKAAAKDRRAALAALVAAKDPQVVTLATGLLDNPTLRVDAIQALGQFNHEAIAQNLIQRYPAFAGLGERRAALNVLVSRPGHAAKLLDAVVAKTIPATQLTADLVRQLRQHNDPKLNERVTKVWGVVRDSPADKLREIARYKKLLTAKGGDAGRGKPLFSLICGQCHTLYGEGGKVGPDITGANRSDLDYLLHNILDPNAEIPNDYRTTNIDLKDDRSLTGIVTQHDSGSVTIVTAAETLTLARDEIASLRQSELSMMPEGLLQPLNDQQARDLIAYLQK